MGEGNKVLVSASKSISYSIFVQFVFRIATFLINAIIIRFVAKDLIGLVNVRLGLLFSTIYCLTSEPFVRACFSRLDQKNKIRSSLSQTVNLLWFSIPIGLLWVIVCSAIWLLYLDWPTSSITSSYHIAVFCYALAAFIEILSEPIRILIQILLHVRVKPFIEGLALVVENVILIICLVFLPNLGLLSFCIAKVCCTICVSVSYYIYICHQIQKKNSHFKSKCDEGYDDDKVNKNCNSRCLVTKRISESDKADDDNDLKKESGVDDDFPFTSFKQILPNNLPCDDQRQQAEATGLLWSFSKQVILKQGFTEGEKYIMTIFGVLSFADQGVYSIVNNLSSMVVRMLFLPMEEGFYLFLSQSLVRTSNAMSQNLESLKLVARSLEAMLKVRMLLGITVATFGFTCSFLALDIVFGDRLSSPPGPTLLKWNCIYIFLVSINGITEGFHNASTDQKQVEKYNKMMMMFSIAFLTTSWLFTSYLGLGAVGFYLSNCCNMVLRILYSLVYLHKYFENTSHKPIRGLLPSLPVLFAYLVSFFVTLISEACLCHNRFESSIGRLAGYFAHIVIVLSSLGLILFIIYKKEKKLVSFLKEEYFSRGKAKSN